MSQDIEKVLITGATGYVADQMLAFMKEQYETVLVDTREVNRRGEPVEGVNIVDLIDPDRDKYSQLFEGVDAVIHLAYKRRSGDPLDHFDDEKQNVEMAYNVFRSSYDAGVKRVVMASSNHAADWYEHALIHNGNLDIVRPYDLPLSDNFYGWAKATYEHMGFLFASGGMGEGGDGASSNAATGNLLAGNLNTSRKMGVVMVRIGAPRDIETEMYRGKEAAYKRDLGAYISPRDITQLFHKAMETKDIENEYGVPWQVVYGISNNTRAFWSLTSAKKVLGYEPEDDSEITFRSGINEILNNAGKVGPIDA
tara:strand:+ start:401 stop:1330 length:930 start_codon:yes stop_codon:yes gene_type:complete